MGILGTEKQTDVGIYRGRLSSQSCCGHVELHCDDKARETVWNSHHGYLH